MNTCLLCCVLLFFAQLFEVPNYMKTYLLYHVYSPMKNIYDLRVTQGNRDIITRSIFCIFPFVLAHVLYVWLNMGLYRMWMRYRLIKQ